MEVVLRYDDPACDLVLPLKQELVRCNMLHFAY
jgi:hypothetical protein